MINPGVCGVTSLVWNNLTKNSQRTHFIRRTQTLEVSPNPRGFPKPQRFLPNPRGFPIPQRFPQTPEIFISNFLSFSSFAVVKWTLFVDSRRKSEHQSNGLIRWMGKSCQSVLSFPSTYGVNFTNILCTAFFVRKFRVKLFCTYIKGLNFF